MAKSQSTEDLALALTRTALLSAAGPVYFSRGEGYFDMGAVDSLRERDGVINATVHGTHSYKTSIWLENGRIESRCSCPLGQDYEFCKHLVATGLEFIEQNNPNAKSENEEKPITSKDIEAYLLKQEVPDLVRIIMKQTDRNDEFYAMLKLRAAMDTEKPITSEMKLALQQAMNIYDFVSWNETYDYSRGVDHVLGQLRTLLTPELAAEVIELMEYALDLWEENIGSIDDSDGCMGMIRDDIHEVHLKACRIAKPNQVELAERLALRAINSEWDMFHGSYQIYGRVFGAAGRARYREIVEEEWNRLPSLGEGEKDSARFGLTNTLETMMLAFAEEDKDLDLAMRVLSRDLSRSYNYLRIAEQCREVKKYKLALEWAEKGLAAFLDDPDSRLCSFLAEEYLRAKRPDEAMEMIWVNFEQRTTLKTYEDLAKYARKLKRWESWREHAFSYMRDQIRDEIAEHELKYSGPAATHRWASLPPDHSLLVEILLWEEREDEAWEEARNGGCSENLWLDLAARREQEHPEDAIEIYLRQVEPLVRQTNNRSYEQAVEFLGYIHGLMTMIGKEIEFRTELIRLKTEHKRKRNFIKYVERKAWGK